MGGIFKSVKRIVQTIFGNEPNVPEAPPPPVLTEPTPMPLPDDEAIARAKRRSIAAQMQRSGRQSTLLTNDPVTGETLG